MPEEVKERIPKQMRAIYDSIVRHTDAVCREHLNEEYAGLARKMAAKLARKRPSPLPSGRMESWACGILYSLGRLNFLFDKSQTPYMRLDQLCKVCGVSPATGSAKARAIEDALDIRFQLDPAWTLPSRMDDNPLAWFLIIDGWPVDARTLPRPVQEELARAGFIPYVPESREQGWED